MSTMAIQRGSERGLNGAIGFMLAAGLSGAVCWMTGRTMMSMDIGVMMLNMAVLPMGVVAGLMAGSKSPALPVRSALYFVATALVSFMAFKGLLGGSHALIGFHLLGASATAALVYSRTLGAEDEDAPKVEVDWNQRYDASVAALAAAEVAAKAERERSQQALAEFDRRLRAEKHAEKVFEFETQKARVAA